MFSKCIIRRVLTSHDWKDPFIDRNFSKPNHPQSINYNDWHGFGHSSFDLICIHGSSIFMTIAQIHFPFGFTNGGHGLATHLPSCHTKAKWAGIFGYPILLILSHMWKKPTSFEHLTLPGFSARNINFNIFFDLLSHYRLFEFAKFDGGITSKSFYVVKKLSLIFFQPIQKNIHCSTLLNLKPPLNNLLLSHHQHPLKWKHPPVLKVISFQWIDPMTKGSSWSPQRWTCYQEGLSTKTNEWWQQLWWQW